MHTPVLLNEVIKILNPGPGEFFIDGTLGTGGHAVEIIKRLEPNGAFLGIDWDAGLLERAKEKILGLKFKSSMAFANESYARLPEVLKVKKFGRADGLFLDLGFCSSQLGPPAGGGRGFSFLRDEPLDMRYNVENLATAADVLNSFAEKDLADIFWQYGEERFSRKIAKEIVEARKVKKILTTFDLTAAIKKAVPGSYERGRINPATRVFQALRIFVNRELENLEKLLANIPEILKPSGRLAVISFHSLEDRLVKKYFREMAKAGKAELLTKKPIVPSKAEIAQNPRSRSAKLRAITFYDHNPTQ